MLVVFVHVLKVNQSDNLYQTTRVRVINNVYVYGEMLVGACSKGEPVGQPVPSHEGERHPYAYTLYMTLVAWYRLSDWFTFRTSTNTTNISPYTYILYMTLVAWYSNQSDNLYQATRVSVMYNVYV
jgi:hypothetical protein